MKKTFLRAAIMASLLGSVMPVAGFADVTVRAPSMAVAVPAQIDVRAMDRTDFVTLFPGVLTDHERAAVTDYFKLNEAINSRAPLDVQALVTGSLPADTPGLGPVIHVTKEWLTYQNVKYDPLNPIRVDEAVARAAGYASIPAYPTFGAHDDSVMLPWPPEARDKLLVSDLNHSVTNHLPVYAGDTLYIVVDHRDVFDMTPPEGATRRALAIISQASIYNQNGQKVSDMTFRVTEQVSVFADRSMAPENPIFPQIWESSDWMTRPEHVYTDADWDKITGIWQAEEIRGATPRYWEDVAIGEAPAWTLDGPIEESPTPTWGMGMGSGGSRTIRAEILDADGYDDLVRNETDGIWRFEDPNLQRPAYPELPNFDDAPPPAPRPGTVDTANIHTSPVGRGVLVNFTGRDYAIRHLTNWMGDAGWLRTISWSIMDPRSHWENGVPVMPDPFAVRYVNRVPGMEDAYVSTHGLTKDVALVKSAVTGKRVNNGRFEVELIWWIETIEGQIWEEGMAVVELPSRDAGIQSAVRTAH